MLAAVAIACLCAGLAGHYYWKFARLIDAKLEAGPFAYTSDIYAAPRRVSAGDRISEEEIVRELRRSGYGESPGTRVGWYRVRGNELEIHSGPASYFGEGGACVRFSRRGVQRILDLSDGKPLEELALEPQLITNVSDQRRQKRRLVHFSEIPKVLVDAVVSAEDKRFFQHSGFDTLRLVKAAWIDLKEGRKEQGASTITMQLARSLWLVPDKRWSRKAAEMLLTVHLEQKLPKQKIFEYYANEVYLGQSGTFGVHGFGEASRVYFGKYIRQLTLPEAALLAGLIQRPSHYDPFRFPERALERRNLVLSLMRQNGLISEAQYEKAGKSALTLAPRSSGLSEAPYFVDLVNSDVQTRFAGKARSVYTTLDLDLQRAAVMAVAEGMARLDAKLKKRRGAGTAAPQAALVALDPHTGAVKALLGGRNYGASQLNRAMARRQPGSVFKPFVYAAAFNTGLTGAGKALTAASIIDDEPTTFWYNGVAYDPGNFKDAVYGPITLRQALERSVNVAAVKVAEQIGYGRVAALARAAGLTAGATPAVALGSYDATPLEIAGAYTVFANGGVYESPALIEQIRGVGGDSVYWRAPNERRVLDARVAWLVENLMEGVMQEGTGAGARAQGFTAPAAGKTGTSRDGWFAGFTSRLLCVVWVGFDDGHDLDIEGAHAALPIWTDFMKRAVQLPEHSKPSRFSPPEGIVSAEIDPESGALATPSCPLSRTEFFLEGTQPAEYCGHQMQQALTTPAADGVAPVGASPLGAPVP